MESFLQSVKTKWIALKLWWATSPTIIKIKRWCNYSATVAWAYLKIAVGGILFFTHKIIEYAQNILQDESVKSAINSMNFPAYVGLGLAVIGVITLMARMRKNSEQPVMQVLAGSEPIALGP